jgi:uncharacterized membrane protein YbhN (UPF0104 family)
MSGTWWRWARLLGGVAILAVLVWRVGTGPFLDGLHTVEWWTLAAAVGIGAITTLCSAWRWSLVAHGLGVDVPLRQAFAAYYRSQFLNTTLPGGVLGDVHRGVRHGRDVGDVGRGLRAVGWERSAGQILQIVLTVVVLLVMTSPVQSSMPLIAVGLVAVALGAVLLSRVLQRAGESRWARVIRTASADIRGGLLAGRAWPGIVITSVLVVAGHTTTFLVAARTAGTTASLGQLLPLALLILLAMAIPTNIGGWGPREGVAAWAFAAAGLGADLGIATAVVYGVMALVANLPGAAVLITEWLHRQFRHPEPTATGIWQAPAAASPQGAARG